MSAYYTPGFAREGLSFQPALPPVISGVAPSPLQLMARPVLFLFFALVATAACTALEPAFAPAWRGARGPARGPCAGGEVGREQCGASDLSGSCCPLDLRTLFPSHCTVRHAAWTVAETVKNAQISP